MKIVKTSETPWTDGMQRGNYHNQRKELGGLTVLKTGMWSLAPGKKSFPLHRHNVTEEALFVVSGHGKVRTDKEEVAIGPGDYVAFPPRGAAHQLINDGSEPLVYLGISANPAGVDVIDYPDTAKVACTTGPGGRRLLFAEDHQVDYFHNDKDA